MKYMSLGYKCISQSGAAQTKRVLLIYLTTFFQTPTKDLSQVSPLSTFALISILFSPTRVNFRKSVSHFVSFAISIKKGMWRHKYAILRLPRGQKFVKNITKQKVFFRQNSLFFAIFSIRPF